VKWVSSAQTGDVSILRYINNVPVSAEWLCLTRVLYAQQTGDHVHLPFDHQLPDAPGQTMHALEAVFHNGVIISQNKVNLASRANPVFQMFD
jgi:hypothetical protein